MQPTVFEQPKITKQDPDIIGFLKTSIRYHRGIMQQLKAVSWSALFGSLFIFAQSYALSIQEIQINSALGEPLDAIVQINAAPGEFLNASCIHALSPAATGMPTISGVRLSLSRQISPGSMRLTTRQPVNEPLSEVVVHIECPGAPSMKRSFLVMLDPRGVIEANTRPATAVASNVITTTSPPLITSNDNRIRVRSRGVTVYRGEAINPGGRYIVANGDALSTIASRIKNRDYGTVWSWSATIEAANPHAFINGNPNELIAGSELYIPTALAAGTAALRVPPSAQPTRAPISTTPATANSGRVATRSDSSRYADRFSTSTNSDTPKATQPGNEYPPEERASASPAAVNKTNTTASGNVMPIQPVMAMATSFSSVSRQRLRQRDSGLIQAMPDNLPDFVRGDEGQAANDPRSNQSNTPPGDTVPEQTQSPAAPTAIKPEQAIQTNPGRRFSFLGLLTGLALLAAAFFGGWFLSRRRAEQEMEETVKARLSEERYRERIRSDRQDLTRQVLSGGAAAGIEVTESTVEHSTVDSASGVSNEDLEDVINEAFEENSTDIEAHEAETQVAENSNVNRAEPITDNEGPLIDPAELDLDLGDSHELGEVDLELLERDYAAQTETNTSLEDIAKAGRGNKTSIVEQPLDMEFPEQVKMRDRADKGFDTLEFDPRSEPLDFDIGEVTDEAPTTEELSLDLEEAGANIDAQLEELRRDDNSRDNEQRHSIAAAEKEFQELNDDTEELLSEEDMTATSTRDAEEFYHLEASSIMHVGELDFEKDPDDETNILRFRQRNIRTGTDDSSGDKD